LTGKYGVFMVLVVDDCVDMGRVLVRLLRRFGVDSTFVASGQGAIDFLHDNVPSLMILDVMMPGLGGFDVLKLVRADPKLGTLPIVMYSALSDTESQNEAVRLGASDYMVKGRIDYEGLKAVVEKHTIEANARGIPVLS